MMVQDMTALEQGLVEFLRAFEPCFLQTRSYEKLAAYGVGLLTDIKRKSIEPIALAGGGPPRTLQLWLSNTRWDDGLGRRIMHYRVAARVDPGRIGVLDSSGHVKQGKKTPGVQRQWCGEVGKKENCVIGQHLLYTNNDAVNPFSCMLASDLFLPDKEWSQDRERCREAGIPDTLAHRPKWKIGIEQVEQAMGNGIRFDWIIGDSDYGTIHDFWFELDRLGQQGVAEVSPRFVCWATPPSCRSGRAEHSSKRVDNLATYSPVFTEQAWTEHTIKLTTRGPAVWKVKSAPVQLVAEPDPGHHGKSVPTDRRYWLIVAHNPKTDETKYLVSNASASTDVADILRAMWARWHVEKWFERAKQEAGLGAFEVRTYISLIRHWLIVGMLMLFVAEQTESLRKKTAG